MRSINANMQILSSVQCKYFQKKTAGRADWLYNFKRFWQCVLSVHFLKRNMQNDSYWIRVPIKPGKSPIPHLNVLLHPRLPILTVRSIAVQCWWRIDFTLRDSRVIDQPFLSLPQTSCGYQAALITLSQMPKQICYPPPPRQRPTEGGDFITGTVKSDCANRVRCGG